MRKEAEERINHYRDRLVSMGDEALDTIHRKLTSPNEAVSLRAALEILDRSGVITTRKTESSVTVTTRSQLDEKISELLDAQERLGDDVATSPSPPSPPTSFHAGAPATFANITDPFRPSRDDDLPAFTSPSHSHSAGLGLSSTDLTNDDTIPPPPPPPPPF